MTFPVIPSTAAGTLLHSLAVGSATARTFPSLSSLTKSPGDLLIAIAVAYQSSASAGAVWSGWPSGWTELADVGGGTSSMTMGVAYTFSTGAETGTFTVTQAAAITGDAAMILLAIPGAHPTQVPAVTALATGTSTAANPAALTPSWGADDTLWIAVSGSGETSTTGSFTGNGSAPSGYTGYTETGISADAIGGCGGAVAFLQLNTATEDAGSFTVDVSNARSAALVIAVRPPVPPAPVSSADTASGTDMGLVSSQALSSADSAGARDGGYGFGGDWAHAAEAGSAAPAGVPVSSADTASATGAGSVHAALSGADSGHALEAASVHATLSGTGTGHGTEGVTSLHATLSGADTGHGADAATAIRVSGSDTGHGTDAALPVRVLAADYAIAAETDKVPAEGWFLARQAAGSSAALAGNSPQVPLGTGAGTLVVAVFTRSGGAGTGALTGVQDSAGNTWHNAAIGAVSGLQYTRAECWYTLQDAGPVTWVQGLSGTPQTWGWEVMEWAGATAVALDAASPANSGSASGATVTTPSVTSAGSTDLAIAGYQRPGAGADVLTAAGWTAMASPAVAGSSAAGVACNPGTAGHGVAAGPYDGTWNLAASSQCGTFTVTFSGTVSPAPGADSGHGAEGSPPVIRVSSADTGHAAEAAAVTTVHLGADTGHGTDAGSVHAAQPGADTGHGTDAGSVHAALFKGDTGHGADSPIGLSVLAADSGHGTDAGSVHAAVPKGDAGHGADAAQPVRAGAGDTAIAHEAAQIAAHVSAADSAIGTESGKITAVLLRADAGHAAEAGSVFTGGTPKSSADAVKATESAFYYIFSADTASAAEGPRGIAVRGTEACRAADRPLNSWPSSADASARTAERAWWSGPLTVQADAGHLAESVKPFPFSSADSAHAVEVTHETGIWTYIPVNVRLEGKFWRVTGRDEQGNEIVLLEAEQLSGEVLRAAERVRLLRVRLVSSADCARSGDAVASEPVAVTCWVVPAVAVSVTVTAAERAGARS